MTNDQVRAEVRKAKYTLEPLDEARIERTLSHLPRRKTRSIWEKFAVAVPAAATVMAFMVFAMPPIVKAVGALIEHIFAARVEEIDRYQALPEDERLSQLIDDYEAAGAGHALKGANVDFEGVTVQVSDISMSPEDRWDTTRKDGSLQLILTYSEIPSFDPNWIDFTLHYAGASYPAKENASGYRLVGKRATTLADWQSDELDFATNTYFIDGVLASHISFDVEQWKPEEKTDMVLEGSIDGKRFDISFSFDPQAAHEESLLMGAERLDAKDRYAKDALNVLKQYEEAAVVVGAHGDLNGMPFTVAEMARVDSELHIAASLAGVTEKNPIWAELTYSIKCIYVDGRMGGPSSWGDGAIDDGVFSFISHFDLDYFLDALPEESLICVEMGYSIPGEGEGFDAIPIEFAGYAAFKYNWSTRAVTLPRDDAQRDEWVRLSNVK